ncbi:MAG TPA: winged helix-turn-helix domain-containing protein [Urbifossiella sp.]|jgi:hypothetical protein|nr:winged helix-turn-helix domain-containing protein [Urbifossiella sp.]
MGQAKRAAKGAGKARKTAAGPDEAPPAADALPGAAGPAVEGKLSALGAAARVLAEAGTAMSCPELVGVMAAKGYWTSPAGKTPAATLYAGIVTEIRKKGEASRFRKAAPGRFAAAGAPGTLAPGAAGRRKAPAR